jgi:transcriptional regulator with XRE-family HTH domain
VVSSTQAPALKLALWLLASLADLAVITPHCRRSAGLSLCAFAFRRNLKLELKNKELGVTANKTPNPIDSHVGNRVRMQRILLKMSQEKLGEALGITFQQVQKYEKGVNRISASRLQQIAQFLNVPPSFFFQDAPDSQASAPAAGGFSDIASSQYVVDFLSTTEGLQLNRAFARINEPKTRKRIIELVATIADQFEKQLGSSPAP